VTRKTFEGVDKQSRKSPTTSRPLSSFYRNPKAYSMDPALSTACPTRDEVLPILWCSD
jgi:hypothetical protein